MPSDILKYYQSNYRDVEGFFMPLAMATWDFLFGVQNNIGATGGMLEIGVFQGKSGILSALHMTADEPAYFIDLHESPSAQKNINEAKPENVHFLTMNSINALKHPALIDKSQSMRWVHIDGEHTGYATATDLETAMALLSDKGIICVDDFFNFKYPQLTAAVYQFLLNNPFEIKMFLVSANKCYLCRTNALDLCNEQIKEHAINDMQMKENDWTLSRTSYLHDFGCYSIIRRNKERDFVGLDQNINAHIF